MKDLAQRGLELWAAYWPKLLAAGIVLVVGWIIAGLLAAGITRAMQKARLDAGLVGFVGAIIKILLIAVVIISALGQLGIQTASFAAILAAAGLAIGLALQGSLANFAAGIMLLFFRPFKVGDYVEAAGVGGTVEALHIFASTLRTPDNKTIIIPNASIRNNNIINYSANETRRVDMVFGVSYGDDLKKVRAIFEELLAADERVLKDPAPVIVIGELGDNSVNFYVRPWCNTSDYWTLKWDFTENVKLRFDADEVSIPFPQRDVHLHQVG